MDWLSNNWPTVTDLALTHLKISLAAIVISLIASVALGWVAHTYRRAHGPLLTGLSLLYAIPSLPLLLAIPMIFGTSLRTPTNMVIALTLYGIAVLVRQTSDGFDAVPADIRLSADACGMSRWQRFWKVDLPLATPVIMAGLRVVTVSTVSLVTVGAVIGIQSLGTLFTDGFQRGITAEIFAGLVVTVLLALLLDGVCLLCSRFLSPWTKAARR